MADFGEIALSSFYKERAKIFLLALADNDSIGNDLESNSLILPDLVA